MTKSIFSEFDTFDIAFALYLWLQHNWGGMSDPKYAAFCSLTAPGMFSPGAMATFDTLDDMAREVYDLLSDDNYKEALELVLNYEPT